MFLPQDPFAHCYFQTNCISMCVYITHRAGVSWKCSYIVLKFTKKWAKWARVNSERFSQVLQDAQIVLSTPVSSERDTFHLKGAVVRPCMWADNSAGRNILGWCILRINLCPSWSSLLHSSAIISCCLTNLTQHSSLCCCCTYHLLTVMAEQLRPI